MPCSAAARPTPDGLSWERVDRIVFLRAPRSWESARHQRDKRRQQRESGESLARTDAASRDDRLCPARGERTSSLASEARAVRAARGTRTGARAPRGAATREWRESRKNQNSKQRLSLMPSSAAARPAPGGVSWDSLGYVFPVPALRKTYGESLHSKGKAT